MTPASADDEVRNTAPPRPVLYRRVLAAYDGSEPSDGAFELGAYLADALGAQLDVAHVVETHPDYAADVSGVRDELARLLRARERTWGDRLEHLSSRAAPAVEPKPTVLVGRPADELLAQADRTRPDLIVAGTHGVGHVKDMLFGSVSHRLLRHAACDLLFVREPLSLEKPPTIVVGVDASPAANRAVEVADVLAQALDSRVVLVHVAPLPPFGGSHYLSEETRMRLRAELRLQGHEIVASAHDALTSPPNRIEEDLREGYVRPEMLAACGDHKPAIVVVGTRGTGGFPGLLVGSVTRDLLDYSAAPVLVVRPPAR